MRNVVIINYLINYSIQFGMEEEKQKPNIADQLEGMLAVNFVLIKHNRINLFVLITLDKRFVFSNTLDKIITLFF